MTYRFTGFVSTLQGGLHGFCELSPDSEMPAYPTWGAGRRCNSLEWNNHSASLRLALHTIFHGLQAIESRSPLVGHLNNRRAWLLPLKRLYNHGLPLAGALHPVQLRFPG